MNIMYSLHLLQNVFAYLRGHIHVVIRLRVNGHVESVEMFCSKCNEYVILIVAC